MGTHCGELMQHKPDKVKWETLTMEEAKRLPRASARADTVLSKEKNT